MTTNLNPSNALFLANLDRIEQRLADANAQVSSGKKIRVASDAPDEIASLLQLRADQQRNAQIQANLVLAQADAQGADSALTGAISLLDRATSLAAQAATGTQTAASRASIAPEVQSLLEQMVALSQTQVQGRYIFSGDRDSSRSYQVMLAAADGSGVTALNSAMSTRQIEDPAGGSFAASKTAQEIFGPSTQALDEDGNPITVPASDNSFAALNGLRVALLKNDTAGIKTAIDGIKRASLRLNSMQSFYGTVEDRVRTASDFAMAYDSRLRQQIGEKEDADIPTAALQLTQANTELQAALTMQGKMPNSTLFSYLG
jgi:flagellar hook-associated protein 3 FlgL